MLEQTITEHRIAQLERKIRKGAIDAQKEKAGRWHGMQALWRGISNQCTPQALQYCSFVGSISDEDKKELATARKMWRGNNRWIKTYPDFERWLVQRDISQTLLSEILKATTDYWDPRKSPYRTTTSETIHNLVTPSREAIPGLIRTLNYESKNREQGHPVEQAAEIHYNFLNIRPLQAGNDEVAEMLINLTLVRNNYPAIKLSEERKEKELYLLSTSASHAARSGRYFADFMTWKMMRALTQN